MKDAFALKKPYDGFTENYNAVFRHYSQFEAYRLSKRMTAYQNGVDKNMSFYSGINGQQWNGMSIQDAINNDKPIHTLNIIKPTIEQLEGEIMSNPLSINFSSAFNGATHQTDLMKRLFDYDFNRGRWRKEISEFVRNYLIHTGVMQIYPDYRNDDKGNVGFRSINPSSILFDPYWITDDINDCAQIFRTSWMTIEAIRHIAVNNQQTNAVIENAYKTYRNMGDMSSGFDVTDYRNLGDFYFDSQSNTYRVIETVWMETVDKKRVKNLDTGEYVAKLDFHPEDTQMAWMNRQVSGQYALDDSKISVCRTFMFVPGLGYDVILSDGLYPLQIGRLPFIIASASNLYGERQGIVDSLIDPQIMINKRESTASDYLEKMARGNWMYESDAFNGDAALKRKFLENIGKTGRGIEVGEDDLNNNKIKELTQTQPPTDLWAAADRGVNYIQKISGISAAMLGQTKAHDTSTLFSDQVSQAELVLHSLNEVHSDVMKQMGEMYFYAAKEIYKGNPRKFNNNEAGQLTAINVNAMNSVTGERAKYNSIANLPRHNVTVTQSKFGMTVRKRYLSMYSEMVQRVSNPLQKIRLEMKMLEYMDIPEDEKMAMKEDFEIYRAMLLSQLKNQTMQNEAGAGQADQMLQQMNAPQQQGMGAPPQMPMTPRQAASAPGSGPIPESAGMGSGTRASGNNAPSDMNR